MRFCGAPITWGVSELPGWGYRMPRQSLDFFRELHGVEQKQQEETA